MGFHPYFPENAITKGADVVIHSLHKTLPALTQTALIHLNGQLIDRKRIRHYLQIFQTSSPSYVLMASMDECLRKMAENGTELFGNYVNLLESTRKQLQRLKHIRLLETENFDRSKIVLSVKDTVDKKEQQSFTGKRLYERLLSEYHLQMEMAAGSYVIAMTSPGDTNEGMNRLVKALSEIDRDLDIKKSEKHQYELPSQEQVYTSFEVEEKRASEKIQSKKWQDAIGLISMEYAYLYPPGIPLIVPGERITKDIVKIFMDYQKKGFSVEGICVENYIEVLINE